MTSATPAAPSAPASPLSTDTPAALHHPAHAAAVAHLQRTDPVISDLIQRVGRTTPAPQAEGTHLGAIVRSIVYQQLSGRAAATIHGRLLALFGGRPPTADELLATPDEALRSVGLSAAKTRYIKDLAQHVRGGTLPVESLHELDDDALMQALTSVKGIGRWTAQMFMMFRLGRPNVLPDLDLGVRKAIQRAYRLRRMPTPKEVLRRGAPWSPYASIAAWYLWRSLELETTTRTGKVKRADKRAGKRKHASSDRKNSKSVATTKITRRKKTGTRKTKTKNTKTKKADHARSS